MSTDIFNRMGDAKPIEDRNPFFDPGPNAGDRATYKATILDVFFFNSKKHGEAIGVDALIDESTNAGQPAGTIGFQAFFVNRKPYYVDDTKEIDALTDFVAKLVGCTLKEAVGQARKLLGNTEAERVAAKAAQRARGIQIEITAVRSEGKKPDKKDPSKLATYVDRYFAHVEGQSAEGIKVNRERVEAMPSVQAHLKRAQRRGAASGPAPVNVAELPPAPAGWQYNEHGQLVKAAPAGSITAGLIG